MIFAFNPPQFSDYQRKDLAKAGVVEVIYKFESNKSNSKRNDTLSIRQYDFNGFLTALDSFPLKKDTLSRVFLSRRINYSTDGRLSIVRIEEIVKQEVNPFRVLKIQIFDESKVLTTETYIVNADTTVYTYTYDTAGNCIEKIGLCINRDKSFKYSYIYEYDNTYKILKEESRYNNSFTKKDYYITYKYNSAGQPIESKERYRGVEKYQYNRSGKIIRYENSCPSSSSNRPTEEWPAATEEVYTYVYDHGRLSRIKYQETNCSNRSLMREQVETLTYLPNKLIASRCNPGGCYRYIYLKN
ncbi:hypothetical protein CNR22_18355 [Sphingobacteriaceae bacterium]|nr:hypothetical protein CNR22_18355 [Sphingobacteriaceae bacterium]